MSDKVENQMGSERERFAATLKDRADIFESCPVDPFRYQGSGKFWYEAVEDAFQCWLIAAASSRAPEGAATQIDVSNLRFYAQCFQDYGWQTPQIASGVFIVTLREIADRIAAHAHSEGAQENALEVLAARWEEYYEAFTSPHHTVTAPPDAMKGLRQCIDELKQAMGKLAHSEGVDAKELAELRAIVGRCEKTSAGVLGGRCDRPKGHRGSHETRNRMTTWLGPNDEPELSEGVDGWFSAADKLLTYIEDHGWGTIPEPHDSIIPLYELMYGRCPKCQNLDWRGDRTKRDHARLPDFQCDDPWHNSPAPPKESTR